MGVNWFLAIENLCLSIPGWRPGPGLVWKIDKCNCVHKSCERGQFPVVCLSHNSFQLLRSIELKFSGHVAGHTGNAYFENQMGLLRYKVFSIYANFHYVTSPLLSHSPACKCNIGKRWQLYQGGFHLENNIAMEMRPGIGYAGQFPPFPQFIVQHIYLIMERECWLLVGWPETQRRDGIGKASVRDERRARSSD